VLGTGEGAGAAAATLGLGAAVGLGASSSQPKSEIPNASVSKNEAGFMASDTSALVERARRFASEAGEASATFLKSQSLSKRAPSRIS
jgi:hypothetical protein